ncbi:MAG: hypothetical protein WCC37_05780 [Candidatus Sulfotelmatobacter sp.]|jgi:hypothetical protein
MSAQTLLELLRQREREKSPLVVYHSPSLPSTPHEVVDAAVRAGRPVLHVKFVKGDGNGGLLSGQLVDR